MKLLVAGATGFLGARVVDKAQAAGLKVIGIARSRESAAKLRSAGIEVVMADLEVPRTVDAAFEQVRPDALINTASLGIGHVNSLIAAALRSEVARAVFVSTATVYSRYEIAGKDRHIAAEQSIARSSLDWTMLRPTMIYGASGDRNLIRLLRLLRRTPIVPIPGDGRCLLQPIHVDDLAATVMTALTSPIASRKTYDLAGPEPITLREVINQAAAAMNRRVLIVPVPLAPTVRLVRLYVRLVESPRIRVDQVQRLGENKTVSICAAADELGFRPRSFRDGITAEAEALSCP